MYKSGFYKFDSTLMYAQNFIQSAEYVLYADYKDTYQYPCHGWYWFDDIESACAHFNLPLSDYVIQEEILDVD